MAAGAPRRGAVSLRRLHNCVTNARCHVLYIHLAAHNASPNNVRLAHTHTSLAREKIEDTRAQPPVCQARRTSFHLLVQFHHLLLVRILEAEPLAEDVLALPKPVDTTRSLHVQYPPER